MVSKYQAKPIAIFLFNLTTIFSGFIHPFSQPLSIIEHSIVLIVTGLSSIFKVQAASHGAGHILPVNSGKLFVECNTSRASFHLLLYTMF